MGASAPRGFTLVEVLLALVLLSFMVMGFQAATGEIINYAAQSDRQAVALQMVEDRLSLIRLDPDYEDLVERYEVEEEALPGYPELSRRTDMVRIQREESRGILDFTTITVAVAGRSLRDPVSRTIVIAAP